MKVTKVSKEIAQIDGSWMAIIGWKAPKTTNHSLTDRDAAPSLRKFFSRLAGAVQEEPNVENKATGMTNTELLATKVSASVFLNVNTATIKDIHRRASSTKNWSGRRRSRPRSTRKLAILTAPYIPDSSLARSRPPLATSSAQSSPARGGKIFIGFSNPPDHWTERTYLSTLRHSHGGNESPST